MTRSAAYRFRTLMGSTLLLMFLASPAFAQSAEAEESLYDRLGGLQGIALVVSDFVDVFVQDPLIMANAAVRERKTVDTAPYIKFQVTAMTCEATGGPCQYTGLNMADAHAGLGVTPEEWDRMVELFAQTLARHGVPDQETQELFAILGPTREDIVDEG
jgi:hemoglobin